MKIKPAHKFLAVKSTTVSGTKSSNLVIVETEKTKPELGEVIEIGTGKLPVVGIKKGSIIAYRAYGGNRYYLGGQEVIFVSFDDCLGVIYDK